MTPLDVLSKHTSSAIESRQFGKTLHDALCELIDCLGLAITVRDDNESSYLVYFIHSNGEEVLPLKGKLSDCLKSDIQVSNISLNSWTAFEQYEFLAENEVTGEIKGYESVARVAWQLGGYSTYDILLFSIGDSGYSGVVSEYLQMAVNLLATGILRRVENTELSKAEGWINKELEEIAKLQETLRPDILDDIKGAEFAVHAEAYRYAGGDYYDVANLNHFNEESQAPLSGDMFSLAIADVSGHGPSAVLELAMLDAILRTYSTSQAFLSESRGPDTVATYVNRNMFTRRSRATFTTAIFSVFNPETRILSHSCAGHPAPIWKKADTGQTIELPVSQDIPICVLQDYQWSKMETSISPGDIMVFYTDGITESRSDDGSLFGTSRLVEAVDKAPPGPQAVIDSVLDSVNRFTSNAESGDDVTLLAVKYH